MSRGSRAHRAGRARQDVRRGARPCRIEEEKSRSVPERVQAHRAPVALRELEIARIARHLPLRGQIKTEVRNGSRMRQMEPM